MCFLCLLGERRRPGMLGLDISLQLLGALWRLLIVGSAFVFGGFACMSVEGRNGLDSLGGSGIRCLGLGLGLLGDLRMGVVGIRWSL